MDTYLPVALTLAGCSIGAGLVALPAAFDQARPPVAGALLGFTALLNIYSLWYVAAAAKLSGATNYGEMALCFGQRARLAMEAMTTITLGGVLISLELIMRDCFTMGLFKGNELHGYAALAVLLVLIVLPLSMQAKMSLLSRSSFLSVVAILYMIGVLVYLGGLNAENGGEALSATPLPSPSRMLGAAPVVIYSLGCQVQAVPLFQELPKLRRGVVGFLCCVAAPAMALCVTLFATTGVFGVLATYPHTDGDVLRSLPEDVVPARVAQLAVGVSLALVTPLIIWPIRTSLNTMIRACTASAADKSQQRTQSEHRGFADDSGQEAASAGDSTSYARLRGGSADAGGGINGNTPPLLRDARHRVAHSRAAGDLASALHPPTVRITLDGTAVVDDWDGARGERVVGPGAPSQGWSAPSPVLQGRAASGGEHNVVLRGRLSKRAGGAEHGTPSRKREDSSDSDWEDTPGRTARVAGRKGLDASVDGISLPGAAGTGAGAAGAPLLSSDSDSRREGSKGKRMSRASRRAVFSLWWWKRLAVTAAVVLVSFGIAFGVPSVLIVFRLIGATAATFLFYIYPALVYLKLTSMVHVAHSEEVQGGVESTQGGSQLAGATAGDTAQLLSPDASSALSTDTVGVTWVDGAVSISTPVQQRPGQLRTVAVSTTARIGSAGETSASDTDIAGPSDHGTAMAAEGGAGGVGPSAPEGAGARNIICGSSLCEGTQVVAVHSCARGGAYFLIFAGVALTALSLYSIVDGFVKGDS